MQKMCSWNLFPNIFLPTPTRVCVCFYTHTCTHTCMCAHTDTQISPWVPSRTCPGRQFADVPVADAGCSLWLPLASCCLGECRTLCCTSQTDTDRRHFLETAENWQLLSTAGTYIYQSPVGMHTIYQSTAWTHYIYQSPAATHYIYQSPAGTHIYQSPVGTHYIYQSPVGASIFTNPLSEPTIITNNQ